MNGHKNARLTAFGRERLVRLVASGHTPQAAARAAGVCPRTVRKWLARYRAEGLAGLLDRSSRPRRRCRVTPAATVEQIIALRHERFTGREASVKLKLPLSGRRRFEGRIAGVEGGKVMLEVDGDRMALAVEDIDRARLVPDV